ncbi:hypothetical protein GLOTRDRAFT_124210 [Gloeophyllum trabeum ATCC 11539]|uniref:Uncharacterized protein n=1 Tax=Gloeophyllum trabeum (strain ATCC 11539 / FP-39264 / Madison 617) TaxID=670483 RepID=S7S3Q8_GLOTA|nr:uncharacterized protein GLOTRDRAFT_124210 [Gloeophyllum trabeum ATCC 11539]EPQ60459.1 hypothetical protein GLOTRDRAFT_124210 [Gloeophyllum trabeum ATCC 11539]
MSNCAIGPDGELKDAADIEWYASESDERPIAGPSMSGSSPASAPPAPSAPVSPIVNAQPPRNAFDLLGKAPAEKVGGLLRSARVSKPSGRVKDPNNAAGGISPPKSAKRRNDDAQAGDNPNPSKRRATSKRCAVSDSKDADPPIAHR